MENVELVSLMLKAIGEDPNREGLKDTPKRVVKMWGEIFRGYDEKQKPKVTTFDNGTDGLVVEQMITDTGSYYSHCEHHIVPFFGNYFFAYVPNKEGKILGLSKVARIVDFYSAKLQIQERLVKDIVDELWKALCDGANENPAGMGLIMEGEHLCKTMRGVKKKGRMTTTELRGSLLDDHSTRSEFYTLFTANKQQNG